MKVTGSPLVTFFLCIPFWALRELVFKNKLVAGFPHSLFASCCAQAKELRQLLQSLALLVTQSFTQVFVIVLSNLL